MFLVLVLQKVGMISCFFNVRTLRKDMNNKNKDVIGELRGNNYRQG